MRGAPVAATMLLGLLLAAAPRPAAAQMLVLAHSDLRFGLLTPGVPMSVAPTDAVRRAAFSIEAAGRFSVQFQLPTRMTGSDGGSIPLVFGAADGRVEIRHKLTTFDPAEGVAVHINPADLRADIYLGGIAQPAVGTPPGSYTATITIIVAANN